MVHTYRWQSIDGTGLEHLSLDYRMDAIVADGGVIGDCGGGRFGCSYRICCDTRWRVRSLALEVAGGASLALTGDGKGHWRDGEGAARPDLDGCIDVDIAATPFTNTLPIRRLGAALRRRSLITVLYIPLPSLATRRMEQAYTRLAGGRYRYEGPIGEFQAELALDGDGLVLDYPSLFTRLLPS